MRDLRKIIVSYKDNMVIAVFFYVNGQENYKNVLASAECFACINYDAMLKDPQSKGCSLQEFDLKEGDRWIGIKWKQRNSAFASRHFTKFEPIFALRKVKN